MYGEANGAKYISKLLLEKYRSLYNSVPTVENELESLRDVIDSNITVQIYITGDSFRMCIGKFKAGKDDGDIGLKSDHMINGTHRLYVLLSLLYRLMFSHGYTPADLLKSTIVSIPKDNKASLLGSDKTIYLLVKLISSWLTMGYYRKVFWLIYSSHVVVLFMVRIYENSNLLF